MLFVCVARPELLETRPGWAGGKPRATTALLAPLSGDLVVELIGNLLGAGSSAGAISDRIAAAAEGNPLFVEEFVAMLIDDGHLVREDGKWVATGDLDRVPVPPTIRSLLAARVDRLVAAERGVMERASVVGQTFWRGAVTDLQPEALRGQVASSLTGLVRKELVLPDRSDFAGDEAFRFRHLLIRDAAYESLSKHDRAGLHEKFAGWLARTAGDREVEYQEILGYHLEQAYRYMSELARSTRQVPTSASGPDDSLGARVSGQSSEATCTLDTGSWKERWPCSQPTNRIGPSSCPCIR
jgi:predicted ATPase